jgi:hypothetical protein
LRHPTKHAFFTSWDEGRIIATNHNHKNNDDEDYKNDKTNHNHKNNDDKDYKTDKTNDIIQLDVKNEPEPTIQVKRSMHESK